MSSLNLPRQIETNPRYKDIERALSQDLRPLWEKGKITVPYLPFSPSLIKALEWAQRDHHLKRGFESIETILNGEKKGLMALHEKQGTAPVSRVSRLLIIPDGCPERFYRSCEVLLYHHEDRLLGLRVGVSFEKLAETLFGEDALVKVLLVSDRDAVSDILLAVVNNIEDTHD